MSDDPMRLLDLIQRAQTILAKCGTPLTNTTGRILIRVMRAHMRGETVTQKAMSAELGIPTLEMSRAVRVLVQGQPIRGLGGLVNNERHIGHPSVVTLAPLGQDILTELLTSLHEPETTPDAYQGNP